MHAALFGLALAMLPPIGATASTPGEDALHQSATVGAPERANALPLTPGAPGLPPPQIAASADRMIIGGAVLLLLAGLSGLTAHMWRELGRRAGAG